MFNRKWIATIVAGCMLGLLLTVMPSQSTNVEAQSQATGTMTQIEIVMSEFSFKVTDQPENTPLTLKAGQPYELIIRDSGVVAHEVMIGQSVTQIDGKPYGYDRNLLESVGVVIKHSETDEFSATVMGLIKLELEKTHEITIQFTIPESLKGEWEFGCFFAGHYKAGMKLPLIVE